MLRSNELIDLFDQYAHYAGDTEPGSSGSPVYNDQWELVALHHSGVPKTDSQGAYIAKDGSVWTPGMDPDDLAWVANEGIRVSSLVDYIGRQPLTGLQAQLRSDLMTLEPPTPLEAAAVSMAAGDAPPARPVSTAGRAGTGPTVCGNAASWTIPLQVTVQCGSQPLYEPVPPAPPPPSMPVPLPVSTAPSQAVDPELREALDELERAPTRTYFDAAKDGRDRDAYYDSLDASVPRGELYAALHALVKRTHKRPLPYKPARHLYPWIDLQPPGDTRDLVSIYSGKRFSARELIETDFAIEKARVALRQSLRRPSLGGQESALDDEALEAALPFNCEHVIPQSWFAKREPMRGDLHHLFACEVGCNSFRGNIPYFDFADFEEVIRDDCGKREEGKFEPGNGKGAVARATLYFLLRYPREINRTSKEYTEDRIETLLAWHEAEPVGEYELHRNAAIFEKQGNRNPLIDFPEWSTRIDFTRGLG